MTADPVSMGGGAGGGAATYRLKVTLAGVHPLVWRRVEVPGHFTLARLHRVIQAAMGWHDAHLHHFEIAGLFYGVCRDEDDEDVLVAEGGMRLDQLLRAERARFRYLYDFADEWRHDVCVERILRDPVPRERAVCTAGRRAAPPDGCGGAWAYADLLAAQADPAHPGHADALDRTGGRPLDPELFDREALNPLLGAIEP